MTTNQTDDQIVLFRGTKRSVGTNKKGEPKERFEFYLNSDQAALLAQSITAKLKNPNGVKIDLHIVKKPSQGGGTFDSAFCFAKAVQEKRTGDKSAATVGSISPQTVAAIEKLKTEVA